MAVRTREELVAEHEASYPDRTADRYNKEATLLGDIIDSVDFGLSQIDGVASFFSRFVRGTWRTIGRATINTETRKIDDVLAYYRQTSALSRTCDFQIIDGLDGTVYFSGSETGTGTGLKDITVSQPNPLPIAPEVILDVQFKSGLLGVGVVEVGTQIEYSPV